MDVVSPLVTNLLENIRMWKSQESLTKGSQRPLHKFASVARGLGKKASFTNVLAKAVKLRGILGRRPVYSSSDDGRASVLTPENRRFLDLQGEKSPDVPKRRIIIGSNSFSIGRNGELIDCDKEEICHDSYGENGKLIDRDNSDARTSRHRDSIGSATSVDSNEEELMEELQKLRLSLAKKPNSQAKSEVGRFVSRDIHHTLIQMQQSSPIKKRKNLMLRLSSGSKRRSFTSQSSGSSSWDIEPHITEEESPDVLHNQIIMENFIATDQLPLVRKSSTGKNSVFDSDIGSSNVFESGSNKDSAFCFPSLPELHKDDSQIVSSPKEFYSDSAAVEVESQNPCATCSGIKQKRVISQGERDEERSEINEQHKKNLNETADQKRSRKHSAVAQSLTSARSGDIGSISGSSACNSEFQNIRQTKFQLRKTSSLPTLLMLKENAQLATAEQPESHLESEEFLKSALNSLQQNFNTAMLAVIQACKTQQSLQEILSRTSSRSMLHNISTLNNGNSSVTASLPLGNVERSSRETVGQTLSQKSEPEESDVGGSREALCIASQMKETVSSVICKLENFVKSAGSTVVGPQPDINNIIGQLLWLSYRQSELCSDLERMSTPDVSRLSPSHHPSPVPWAPGTHYYYRAVPDHVYGTVSSAPPSIYSSSPYLGSPYPPFPVRSSTPSARIQSPIVPYTHPYAAGLTSPPPHIQKNHQSLSESSCEESVELAGEIAGFTEWNEGKYGFFNTSPTAGQWLPNLPGEAVTGDMVQERFPRETEETVLSRKMNQMTTNVDQLNKKMDKNYRDVEDIKDKLNFIIQQFSAGNR